MQAGADVQVETAPVEVAGAVDAAEVAEVAVAATCTGLRGCSADIVILEEAAFLSPDAFFQVVAPLLGVRNTALLAITTPQDEFNYFSELMNLKDQWGDTLFYSIKLGMVCAKCAKSGAACTHKLFMNPHWKPPGRQAKVDAVMACNPKLRDRETRGDVGSTKSFIVSGEQIEALRVRAQHDFGAGKPEVLYSAIDPSGGGAGSDYVILTMAINEGVPVIVGMDRSASADPLVIQRMIDRHYMALRDHPRYRSCLVRVFIEANMSYIDAGRVANQLKAACHDNVEVPSFDSSRMQRPGIWTTRASKEGYVVEIQRCMALLRFSSQFVSAAAQECTKELLLQLAAFRREIIEPPSGAALHATALLTGKSPGRKDDLVMALGIALYYMYRSIYDTSFLATCQRRGIAPC